MGSLISTLMLVLLGLLIVLVVYYVMRAYSLMRLYIEAGYAHPWMAWIPFLNTYSLGDLASGLCSEFNMVPLFGKIKIPCALCRYWFVINIILGFMPGKYGLLCATLSIILSVFFTAGTLSVLMAKLKDTTAGREIGMSFAASVIPFVDVVYFISTRKRLVAGKSYTD